MIHELVRILGYDSSDRHPRFVAQDRPRADGAKLRWVVERTFAWLHSFRRLLVRFDRRADIHDAFLGIACCLVCFRRLRSL